MISISEAIQTLKSHLPSWEKRKSQRTSLMEALGSVIATDCIAEVSHPSGDQSAMDGYTFHSQDIKQIHTPLKIQGSIHAGDFVSPSLEKNSCLKIMTGGLIPQGADTVIPIEDIVEKEGFVFLKKMTPKGSHIRPEGDDFSKGDCILSRGTLINPGKMALLKAAGIEHISLIQKPTITLLTTGHEIVPSLGEWKKGTCIDSNGPFLTSSLQEIGIKPLETKHLPDDREVLQKSIQQALEKSDIVILTGGVSMGDADFVRPVLEELEVKTLFWKVNQKPGKPLYAGEKNGKIIFGLPGNPYAVFVCWHVYVKPFIQEWMGIRESLQDPKDWETVEYFYTKKDTKAYFLKASFDRKTKKLDLFKAQGSHQLKPLADINVLAFASEDEKIERMGLLFL